MSQPTTAKGPLPRRPYGPAKIPLSIIGFGGIVVMKAEQAHANRTVARAVERGVNYFDVAPSYGDAEEKLGPALEPYRRKCFLACKTTKRDAAGALEDMNASMRRLRTDYFDLYQLHSLTDMTKDVDAVFARGGAMEVLIEAKRTGRVRHLGFSAHSQQAALAAMDRYDFDSILFPINFVTFHAGDFGPAAVAEAQRRGLSILALKALARRRWSENHPLRQKYAKCWYEPLSEPAEAEMALRFTLSQPVVAALPPGEEELFWLAVDLAGQFRPISAEVARRLAEMAAAIPPIFRT